MNRADFTAACASIALDYGYQETKLPFAYGYPHPWNGTKLNMLKFQTHHNRAYLSISRRIANPLLDEALDDLLLATASRRGGAGTRGDWWSLQGVKSNAVITHLPRILTLEALFIDDLLPRLRTMRANFRPGDWPGEGDV